MSYYDRIAAQWDEETGPSGGAFKRLVLNDRMLALIGDVSGRDVLEVGAGNGYLARLLARRHSGREPARLVVSDASARLLEIAARRYAAPRAEYVRLDLRQPLPLEAASFDLVVAVMVLNELPDQAVSRALGESARVLRADGRIVGAVLHPLFTAGLSRRGEIKRGSRTTMPGPGGLRVPVVVRTVERYRGLFDEAGFSVSFADVHASAEVLSAKPGLRHAGNRTPVALQFDGRKRTDREVEV